MNSRKCYECKHRRDIPGDCHSRCVHPGNGFTEDNPLSELLSLLGKRVGPVPQPPGAKITVTGNAHGIKHGWFNWPFNFDPIWLESCDGFEVVEKKA